MQLARVLEEKGLNAGVFALLAVVMIVLMPDRVHRFLCTLIAAGCAVVALRDLGPTPAQAVPL